MAKKVVVQKTPQESSAFSSSFDANTLNDEAFFKGYEVFIEKASKCPCVSVNFAYLKNCKNCGGSGFVFYNRKKTRAIVSNQEVINKYRSWDREDLGTALVTFSGGDSVGFMDKIEVAESNTIYSETKALVLEEGSYFSFLSYSPKEVENVFLFVAANALLRKLEDPVDYTIVGNKIVLNVVLNNLVSPVISIRYKHTQTYHVIENLRDNIVYDSVSSGKEDEKNKKLPTKSLVKVAHSIMEMENFQQDFYLDNSYGDYI